MTLFRYVLGNDSKCCEWAHNDFCGTNLSIQSLYPSISQWKNMWHYESVSYNRSLRWKDWRVCRNPFPCWFAIKNQSLSRLFYWTRTFHKFSHIIYLSILHFVNSFFYLYLIFSFSCLFIQLLLWCEYII
jgi:hypothetical protein